MPWSSVSPQKTPLFVLCDEVVGCIVLGSHPHWEITIQPTVFLKVPNAHIAFELLDGMKASPLTAAWIHLLTQCEVVDCIVVG